MRRVAVGMIVVGLAACSLACGGGGGDYASPKATYQTMLTAAKAGNREAMVACFTEAMRKSIAEMKTVSEDMAKEMPEMRDAMAGGDMVARMLEGMKTAKVEIGPEKITVQTATLEITTAGIKATANFVQEAGAWKIRLPSEARMREGVEKMRKELEEMRATKKAAKE